MQTHKHELLQLLYRNDLLRSTLLMGKISDPGFSDASYVEKIMGLAAEVWYRIVGFRDDSIQKAHIVNQVLFAEHGFQRKNENYKKVVDNPSRFYLHELLDSKLGSPLTVTILYMIVAEQVGLPCVCYSLPTQYLLKVDDELCPFYISPYEHGKFYRQEEFQRKVKRSLSRDSLLSTNLFEQLNHHQLVARLAQRLKHIYVLKGRAFEALRAVEFLTALFPQSPELTRDRGILYCEVEYFSRAMKDLRYYLRQRPNADDFREIKKLTSMLSGYQEIIN